MTVYLIGVGMGNRDTMTTQATEAIEKSELLIGSARLLEHYSHKKCIEKINAVEIVEEARNSGCEVISVLLSGDVGFYSGANKLYTLFDLEKVYVIPGISSLVYFAAKLRMPWQDATAVSAHGREHNVVGEIQRKSKVFALTGGNYTATDLISELCARGLSHVRVHVGEYLSYENERIVSGTAAELVGQDFASLSVVMTENHRPIKRKYTTPTMRDEQFARGNAPMTKEEVRAISLSKLHLKDHHNVWDVGAGTGSVSVEIALAVTAGNVYAVEKNPDAVELIVENKLKYSLTNIAVVEGLAPEALQDLPTPDRVFLGGTSGNLKKIMDIALEKNPQARFVINAVTLETLNEAVKQFANFGIENPDIIQMSITRIKKVGSYNMMNAQNPVWIISGEVAE